MVVGLKLLSAGGVGIHWPGKVLTCAGSGPELFKFPLKKWCNNGWLQKLSVVIFDRCPVELCSLMTSHGG